jgi:hypothetical protein
MSQSGFDMSKMSTASKILLGAGVLYLIDLLLRWQEVCIEGIACVGRSGASGIGVLNLLLVLALVVWEVMWMLGVQIQAPRALISAALAAGIVLFTVLKILIDNEAIAIWAWIGLILALAIGYGGWMRWQEAQASGQMKMGGMGGGGLGGGGLGGGDMGGGPRPAPPPDPSV